MNLIRRPHAPSGAGLLLGLAAVLAASLASAQPEEPPVVAPPAEPPPAQPAPAQPAPAQPPPEPPAQPPVEEAAPAQPPAVEATPEVDESATLGLEPAPPEMIEPLATEEPPAEEEAAASPVSLSMFADAYAVVQTNDRGTNATSTKHRAYAGQGPTGLSENGFSLSFIGIDATYDGGEIGATASLRFGSSVPIFHENDPDWGIDNIIQGYLTWMPSETVALDAGMFGTIFGAEVAESWLNLNYTRGALYYFGQPFWHTGVRGTFTLSDEFALKAMVVNGTNNISETTDAPDDLPTFALQAAITPSDVFSLYIGGMTALNDEPDNDSDFDIFGDLVATLSLDAFSLIFNGDVIQTPGHDGATDRTFIGLSLAAGYAFTEAFGVAVRGEQLIDDPGDAGAWKLTTLTGTFDIKPIPDNPNFIVRWDNRYEMSNQDVFGTPADENSTATGKDNWFASVLGFVVHTP